MSLLWTTATTGGYPTSDTVENLTKHYTHADGPSWDAVKHGYIEGHPANQEMREDIRQNGIKVPIKVDYDQSPPQVVDGHTRLWHAEALGLKEVPVQHSTFGEAHYGDDWLGF